MKVPPCRLWSSTSTRYPEALVRQLAGAFLRLEAAPRGRGRPRAPEELHRSLRKSCLKLLAKPATRPAPLFEADGAYGGDEIEYTFIAFWSRACLADMRGRPAPESATPARTAVPGGTRAARAAGPRGG